MTEPDVATSLFQKFDELIAALSDKPKVSLGNGKGFGAGTIKVNGKIAAMISSKGQFVVKLSKTRVDQLVDSGKGERFDPGHGRVMKEWIALSVDSAEWVSYAVEAYDFALLR